jgi:CRP-like cAMP-binding protein
MKSDRPRQPTAAAVAQQKKRPARSSPPDRWHEFRQAAPAMTCPAGTVLLREGQEAQDVYLIEQGLVKLFCTKKSGQEVIIGLRAPGWVLGAALVLTHRHCVVTARTLTRCQLRRLSADAFLHLMATHTEIVHQVHDMHSQELLDQLRHSVELVSLSAVQRLEQFLWHLVTEVAEGENRKPVKLQLLLKHYELAQFLWVTPQHLSKMFNQLEERQVVRRNKGWVIILDREKLWHPDVDESEARISNRWSSSFSLLAVGP